MLVLVLVYYIYFQVFFYQYQQIFFQYYQVYWLCLLINFTFFTFNYVGERWLRSLISSYYNSMDEYIFDDDISNTPESSIVSNQKGRYECI
jgi:hypothetical protein